MAGHQTLRLNLASAIFPFSTSLDGRDIIAAGEDQNYNYISQIGEPVKDRGIPQALYMHNVLPTAQGYQAVAWEDAGLPPLPTPVLDGLLSFTNVTGTISSSVEDAVMSFPGLVGYGAASEGSSFHATGFDLSSHDQLNCPVTQAFLQQTNYLFFGKLGMYKIRDSTLAMDAVTPAGLTVANIQGICAAQGYMIAWDYANNIVWSNSTNPIDFVPSIATGAGGGGIQQVKGTISFCVPIAGGFIIYCSENIVSATYTGNSQFPFAFKEIQNGGSIPVLPQVTSSDSTTSTRYIDQIAYQDNLGYHYAFTSAGVQQIDLNQAQNLFPEITEFLTKQIYEDFDESTNILSTTYLAMPLRIKLSYVGNRYIVFSYAIRPSTVCSQALLFDTTLQRWGKLKVDHVKCIDYAFRNNRILNTAFPVAYSTAFPMKNIVVIDASGNINAINMDLVQIAHTSTIGSLSYEVSTPNGVLIIGKVQYRRNNFIIHQWTGTENLGTSGSDYSVYLVPTLDGKTFLPAIIMSNPPNLIQNSTGYKRTGMRYTCQNFSLLYKGSFNLVSLLIDFTLGGHR